MKASIEVPSSYLNISNAELKAVHRKLRAAGVDGLQKFVAVEEVMTAHPDYFADDLLTDLLVRFGALTNIT